jgi:hypothetical protein
VDLAARLGKLRAGVIEKTAPAVEGAEKRPLQIGQIRQRLCQGAEARCPEALPGESLPRQPGAPKGLAHRQQLHAPEDLSLGCLREMGIERVGSAMERVAPGLEQGARLRNLVQTRLDLVVGRPLPGGGEAPAAGGDRFRGQSVLESPPIEHFQDALGNRKPHGPVRIGARFL